MAPTNPSAPVTGPPPSADGVRIAVVELHGLRASEVLSAAAHHEKLDGSGYPLGLAGDEITLSARILVVSDIFDALTSARPYRPALALEPAVAILERDAGSKLDASCVAAVREWAAEAIAA